MPNADPDSPGRRVAAPLRKAVARSILLLLGLPGPALAASFACAPIATLNAPSPAKAELAELEEVVVTPGKVTGRTKDLGTWLRRLEGQYSYEGYIDLCGNGNAADQRPVTGRADCVSLYARGTEHLLSLYCVVNVRWPQVQDRDGALKTLSESRLAPAMLVYGVLPDVPGIQFMQIDSKGIATQSQGKLAGDTLTTTGSCGLSGSCQKVTRIIARPDSQNVAMVTDFEIDSRRVLRHAFLMRRVSNVQMRKVEGTLVTRDDLPSVGQR